MTRAIDPRPLVASQFLEWITHEVVCPRSRGDGPTGRQVEQLASRCPEQTARCVEVRS